MVFSVFCAADVYGCKWNLVVEFPERPGSLGRFHEAISTTFKHECQKFIPAGQEAWEFRLDFVTLLEAETDEEDGGKQVYYSGDLVSAERLADRVEDGTQVYVHQVGVSESCGALPPPRNSVTWTLLELYGFEGPEAQMVPALFFKFDTRGTAAVTRETMAEAFPGDASALIEYIFSEADPRGLGYISFGAWLEFAQVCPQAVYAVQNEWMWQRSRLKLPPEAMRPKPGSPRKRPTPGASAAPFSEPTAEPTSPPPAEPQPSRSPSPPSPRPPSPQQCRAARAVQPAPRYTAARRSAPPQQRQQQQQRQQPPRPFGSGSGAARRRLPPPPVGAGAGQTPPAPHGTAEGRAQPRARAGRPAAQPAQPPGRLRSSTAHAPLHRTFAAAGARDRSGTAATSASGGGGLSSARGAPQRAPPRRDPGGAAVAPVGAHPRPSRGGRPADKPAAPQRGAGRFPRSAPPGPRRPPVSPRPRGGAPPAAPCAAAGAATRRRAAGSRPSAPSSRSGSGSAGGSAAVLPRAGAAHAQESDGIDLVSLERRLIQQEQEWRSLKGTSGAPAAAQRRRRPSRGQSQASGTSGSRRSSPRRQPQCTGGADDLVAAAWRRAAAIAASGGATAGARGGGSPSSGSPVYSPPLGSPRSPSPQSPCPVPAAAAPSPHLRQQSPGGALQPAVGNSDDGDDDQRLPPQDSENGLTDSTPPRRRPRDIVPVSPAPLAAHTAPVCPRFSARRAFNSAERAGSGDRDSPSLPRTMLQRRSPPCPAAAASEPPSMAPSERPSPPGGLEWTASRAPFRRSPPPCVAAPPPHGQRAASPLCVLDRPPHLRRTLYRLWEQEASVNTSAESEGFMRWSPQRGSPQASPARGSPGRGVCSMASPPAAWGLAAAAARAVPTRC